MDISPFTIISKYLLRICVFQVGEYKRGPFSRYLIRLLKKFYDLSDKYVNLESDFLDGCIQRYEKLGGLRYAKKTLDGLAEVDYMLLTYQNVKKTIEQKGGKWVEIPVHPTTAPLTFRVAEDASHPETHTVHVIYADEETPTWKAFLDEVLKTIGWETTTLIFPSETKTVLLTFHMKKRRKLHNHGCFLRCHSPGASYGMEKKYIAKHLSANKDLCLFDYRGTHKSKGVPSEGGYYLDLETVFQELVQTHAYRPEQIWVSGFCLGGAVAAHLKAKYHDSGIHFVGENTFTSLKNVINHQAWPAPLMGKVAMPAIKAKHPAIAEKVEQDEFNTLAKLSKIKNEKKNAVCVYINTHADAIVPEDSGMQLYAASLEHSMAYQMMHYSSMENNPHADNVFDEERIWDTYLDIIS